MKIIHIWLIMHDDNELDKESTDKKLCGYTAEPPRYPITQFRMTVAKGGCPHARKHEWNAK